MDLAMLRTPVGAFATAPNRADKRYRRVVAEVGEQPSLRSDRVPTLVPSGQRYSPTRRLIATVSDLQGWLSKENRESRTRGNPLQTGVAVGYLQA